MDKHQFEGHAAIITANVIFGLGVPVTKYLLEEWVTPMTYMATRCLGAALIFWDQNWCSWAWIGIPLIGAPLMMYFQQKDYERTGHRTHDQNAVTTMWLFIGAASAASGFTTGFAHIYVYSYCTLQGLFIGMGCFVTGLVSRFRPMTVCGAIGAALTFLCPFLQGDLWPWQFLVLVIVTVVAFIIPGHIIRKVAKI